MTRMENREKATLSTFISKGRPNTSVNSNTKQASTDFRRVGREYEKEKSLMRTALEVQTVKKQQESGLLGEWKKYEEFSKQ